MMFLVTNDSFKAYSDLMTIVRTCEINDINPYVYMQWFIDNAKMRMERYRLSGAINSTAQLCKKPKAGTNGNKLGISLYDPKFYCEFDEIDLNGLIHGLIWKSLIKSNHASNTNRSSHSTFNCFYLSYNL